MADPKEHCRRLVLDAIFYVVRGGIAWRQLAAEFPPATTVYAIFVRWVRAGVWRRIHDASRNRARVRGGRDPQPSAAIIDSQSVQGPDTVPGSSRGCDAVKKTNGRKRHIAVDSSGLLLAGVVTMAGTGMARSDSWLRCALTSQRSVWWADGGYAGRLIE